MRKIITTKDVKKLLGISQRKLDYWLDKSKLDIQRTSSNMRIYTEDDIRTLRKLIGGKDYETGKISE